MPIDYWWPRLALLIAMVCSTTASAQDRSAVIKRDQPTAVQARYPDIPIQLETPALQPNRTTYTTQSELEAFVTKLPTRHLASMTLGSTAGGRNVLALLFSQEGETTAEAVARLGRPVVLLIGQQHGNEPAGSEAMLALAAALANGDLTTLLDKISVAIIPRANPDGAAADVRDNLAGADLNRDHGLFVQPETRFIHTLVQKLSPAVVVDAHEFTVGRRWVELLGGLQAVDLMLLSATHPMVNDNVRELARDTFQPAIEQAIAAHKITSFVYHTLSTRTGDRTISIGGNAPGIARNAFSLMGAVSFLLETRGVGIGLENYQRRVATHYIAAKAILETAARQGSALSERLSRTAKSETESTADIVVAHTSPKIPISLPLIDTATGAEKQVSVEVLDTRIISTREYRSRPAGYVVAQDWADTAIARLSFLGARWCRVAAATDTPIERYEVVARNEADARAINPERAIQVRLLSGQGTVEAGSLYVPLDQPMGARIALAFEPDAPGAWQPPALPIRIPRAASGAMAGFCGR